MKIIKKHISILYIIISLFFIVSCSDFIESVFFSAEIESAEWADGSYNRIYVYFSSWPSNPEVDIDVYVNKKWNSSYYIKSQDFCAFKDSKKTEITLNKKVPKNSRVVITPTFENDDLYGSAELWRHEYDD